METVKKILLIRINSPILDNTEHPHQFYPPFLLKYTQALLEREGKYQTKLFDGYIKPISLGQLLDETLEWFPDMIVLFLTSLNSDNALEYASLVKGKNNGIFIVGVGPDVTLNLPKYTEAPFDFILIGEAEEKLVLLVKSLETEDSKKIQENFYYRDSKKVITVRNLDNLPIPHYSLDELHAYHFLYPIRINKPLIWGHLLGSRGCFHSCIFCSQNTKETYSGEVRTRSGTNIVDEIEYLSQRGANFISFADDDFTISEEYVHSVCDEIQKRKLNIKWTAQARIDEVNFSLLKTMRGAGCSLLAFGVESGSERIIRILQKNDRNIDWIKKTKEVFKDCGKLGIATVALFIIGSPAETENDIRKTIKLAKEIRPDIIQVHFFTPYPGSKAYQQFKRKIKCDVSKLYHYAKPLVNVSNLKLERLRRMQISFYRKFLLRPYFILDHLIKYCVFYFHNKDIFWILFKKTCKLLLGRIKY